MPNSEEIVKQITEQARSWVGTPFKHQGRTKSGCDCIGITIDIGHTLGMTVKDWPRYGRLPSGKKLYQSLKDHLIEIPKLSYEPGDILLMTWRKDPHHVAIVVKMRNGEIGIIHSYTQVKKVVEHVLDAKWKKRIVHTFRFPILYETKFAKGVK